MEKKGQDSEYRKLGQDGTLSSEEKEVRKEEEGGEREESAPTGAVCLYTHSGG